MPISPKLLLFSKVGVKRKMSGLDYSLAYSKLFREMIIRHAHRYVYADRPQKGMLALNARVVNRDIYEYEQQSIAGWHIENVEFRFFYLACLQIKKGEGKKQKYPNCCHLTTTQSL